MTHPDGDPVTDALVRRALQRRPVPDHAPGFWDCLDRRLARYDAEFAEATRAADDERSERGVAVLSPERHNGTRPRGRRRLPRGAGLLAAAAIIAVLVTVALVVAQTGGEVEVGPVDVPDDGGRTSTTSPTPTSPPPTSSSPPPPSASASTPGSDAVLAFLDALGNGDFAAAASRIGLQSEARVNEVTGGSVEDFLTEVQEGYGAWSGADDRTVATVELGPGKVVVVVSGARPAEGAVEHRDDAFPVRHAASADAWFVEPWAYGFPTEDRPKLVTPAAAHDRPQPVDRIDGVEAETPGEGTAWLSIDAGDPLEVTVGPDRRATWSLSDPLAPGQHTLTVAFENDTTFAASASSYVIDPSP